MNKQEQTMAFTRMKVDIFQFLPYIKIQEPGELVLEYELWGHLVDFFQQLETNKLIDLIKSKQIGVCLDPSTLVLTSDLRWVTLDSIQEGQGLAGVDEAVKGQGKSRKYRINEVLNKRGVYEEAFLIETTLGDIIATKEHRFLTDSPDGSWLNPKWRSLIGNRGKGRLAVGYGIRAICSPWGGPDYKDGWVGGVIDGEGSLRGGRQKSGVELTVSQGLGDVLKRYEDYLEGHYCYHTDSVHSGFAGKDVENVSIGRLSDVFEIIGLTRPIRFINRTDWWEGKGLHRGKQNIPYGRIQAITPLGKRRMIDLMTSTGTFIANGFISHNSWALAVYALWKIYTTLGFPVLEISKGETEARALLAKSRIIYNNLPNWMRRYTLEPNTGEAFGFKENKSYIESFPSTETSGIGKTAGLVIHDESDFHPYYETNLGHTRATVADSIERKLVSVSTVNITKPDSYFKRHWKRGEGSGYPEGGQNGFKSLFYGVFSRPGRDQAFYDALVRENEITPWVVKSNYPRTVEEALSPLTAQSCFNKDILQKLWANVVEPVEVRQGFIYIFSRPRVGVMYSAGVDVGEGVGLDYSSLDIIGKEGLNSEVVARIYTNTLATDLFAYEVDKLCRAYFEPQLAVENNSIGVAVINKLVELGYPSLFSSEADRKRQAGKEVSGNEKLGWTTGEKNKQTGIVELIEDINNSSLITRCKAQVKEMMECQWVNGKPEPTGATHGDTIISLMLAHQLSKCSHDVPQASMYVRGRKIW